MELRYITLATLLQTAKSEMMEDIAGLYLGLDMDVSVSDKQVSEHNFPDTAVVNKGR